MSDRDQQQGIAEAIQEVSEKAQLLIREEIELAKAEVTEKLTKLVRGLAIGGAAAVFVLAGLLVALDGFAWLAYYVVPIGGDFAYFWGFFIVALIFFLLGGLAAFMAAKWVKAGSNPAPQMAIDEAKLIKETVTSDEPTKVGK